MSFFLFLVLSIVAAVQAQQRVFDESEIECQSQNAKKECAIVIAGDRNSGWVGYLLLAKRGLPGDINEFVSNPEKFEKKIKKTKINKLFNLPENPIALAGFISYDQKKNLWTATYSAQFPSTKDQVHKRKMILEGIYE